MAELLSNRFTRTGTPLTHLGPTMGSQSSSGGYPTSWVRKTAPELCRSLIFGPTNKLNFQALKGSSVRDGLPMDDISPRSHWTSAGSCSSTLQQVVGGRWQIRPLRTRYGHQTVRPSSFMPLPRTCSPSTVPQSLMAGLNRLRIFPTSAEATQKTTFSVAS